VHIFELLVELLDLVVDLFSIVSLGFSDGKLNAFIALFDQFLLSVEFFLVKLLLKVFFEGFLFLLAGFFLLLKLFLRLLGELIDGF